MKLLKRRLQGRPTRATAVHVTARRTQIHQDPNAETFVTASKGKKNQVAFAKNWEMRCIRKRDA